MQKDCEILGSALLKSSLISEEKADEIASELFPENQIPVSILRILIARADSGGDTKTRIEKRFELLEKLEQDGIYEQALDLLQEIEELGEALPERKTELSSKLEETKEKNQKFFGLVDLLEKIADKSNAINLLRRHIAENETDERVYQHLARLERELDLKRDESKTRVELGDLYLRQSRLSDAQREFVRALRLRPKNTLALKQLTGVLKKRDPSIQSIDDPEKLREEIFVRLKLPREASRELRKEAESSPSARTFERLERIYKRSGSRTGAAFYARKRIEWALNQERDLLLVKTLINEFERRYPEFRKHLQAISGHDLLLSLIHI